MKLTAGASTLTRPRSSAERAQWARANVWLFLLPALVFFVGYQVWPIVRVVWISFTDYQFLTNEPTNLVGFANYADALTDPLMWAGLGRAALFTAMFLPGTIILPLLLAILVDRVRNQRVASTKLRRL